MLPEENIDLFRSIEPHPQDMETMKSLREVVLECARHFNIPLRSVAHKARPDQGDVVVYASELAMRISLRGKKDGMWADKPYRIEKVLNDVIWMLPTTAKDRLRKEHPSFRKAVVNLREEIREYIIPLWEKLKPYHDESELQNPVI